jgi:hypothetical protein
VSFLFRDHRIEFVTVDQPSKPESLSKGVDQHVVALPTRSPAHVATERPARLGSLQAADLKVGVKTHVIRGVVVLEVAGPLSDVVEDLCWEIQLALAEEPRGVVCDLSGVLEGAEPGAVETLATAGRHLSDWSGIPLAVACPDPQVRAALTAHHMGGHLMVTTSVFCAVTMVLVTPTVVLESLRLAPHPTATDASSEFVTRTLREWGLDRLILAANLVVIELVTSSTMYATSDIELSIAWNQRALRLTVRDNSPDVPRLPYTHLDLNGPRPTTVAGLSRALGVLPAADGGKVIWAVLNAAQPWPSTNRRRPEPANTTQSSPILSDVPGPGPAATVRRLQPAPV